MCSKKARRVHKVSKTLLSIVVLALFSGVAFLNFYSRNFEELTGSSRLFRDYLVVLAIAITASLLAKAMFRSVPIFRAFLVAAVTAFMVFCLRRHKVAGRRWSVRGVYRLLDQRHDTGRFRGREVLDESAICADHDDRWSGLHRAGDDRPDPGALEAVEADWLDDAVAHGASSSQRLLDRVRRLSQGRCPAAIL
jgi:hypothetical protein